MIGENERGVPRATYLTETAGLSLRSFLPGPLPCFFLDDGVGWALTTVAERTEAFDVDGEAAVVLLVVAGGFARVGPVSIKAGVKKVIVVGG